MNDPVVLKVRGAVRTPLELTFSDLERVADEYQVVDVSRLIPQRQGDAVLLRGILQLAGVDPQASHVGLHASRDDFHASVPLAPIADAALLIYRLAGKPLETRAGGPVRFFIPNHTACQTSEIDECANVKFVDELELTIGKGHDNRPTDEAEHAKLHQHGN